MKTKHGSIPYAFVFTKLHSIWSLTLHGEQLEAMVLSHNNHQLLQTIERRGVDCTNPAEIQKNMASVMLGELVLIKSLLDSASQSFYDSFIRHYYFENLKTILRYRLHPDPGTDIHFLIIDSPALPRLNVDFLLAAQTVNQFFKLLPPTAEKMAILPILLDLEEKKDMFAAEVSLDRLYFAQLLDVAQNLPVTMRRPALNLGRLEIDIFNIIVLMRNAELYHIKPEAAASFFLPGGSRMTLRLFTKLFALQDSNRLISVLPTQYRDVLEPLAEVELYRRENAMWDLLYDSATRLFRDFGNPAASIAAFPFLKHFEVLNLGRIFEGFRFELPPADIRSMIIGIAHV